MQTESSDLRMDVSPIFRKGHLMGLMGSFKILVYISLRSIFSHKIKSLIVGAIMLFGTFLVVLGTALLDSVERSMSQSIIASLAGHLQVYSADSRDPLALFGGAFMGAEDVGEITDFQIVKETLSKVPNVKSIVPMGLNLATVSSGNEFDRVLSMLHRAILQNDAEHFQLSAAKIRQMAEIMKKEYEIRSSISKDIEGVQSALNDIHRVLSEDFWSSFQTSPTQGMEFLDTKIAKLASNGNLLYLRYLGTDIDLFVKSFDRFEIVEGEIPPQGKRGFLFSKKFYEDVIKNKVARELDQIHEAISKKGETIAKDPILQAKAAQLPKQYRRITLQLDPENALKLNRILQEMFPEVKGDLSDRIEALLTLNDENFKSRYQFFYDTIAPMLRLYDIKVGDTLTLNAFTKSGYIKAVNVKVYGIFTFKGLDDSDLAGATNLMDMITFRDLYGLMTEDQRKELSSIKQNLGVKDVDRAQAEVDLFGATEERIAIDSNTSGFDEFSGINLSDLSKQKQTLIDATYSQAEIDRGLVINAAIILEDDEKIQETQHEITKIVEENKLNLKVVDWQTASGVVGQFIIVIRLVLYIAIFIIFLVALVIINNSMVMATMERLSEIGTMRAIGAQRWFVLSMFLLETLVLGGISGTLGAMIGCALILFLGQVGIPAGMDVLVFLFSGPRLYPTFGISNLLFGFFAILAVSIVSTLYPAWIATRIQPVEAIQDKEQN